MSLVREIERSLARQRRRQERDTYPELRLSTMTHLAWVPPRWLDAAKATLAGLEERHPARTILLIPEPGRKDGVEASAVVHDFAAGGGREVLSEVIEVRLRGRVAEHPASVVLPLLVSDLPVFCRWRGEPDWGGNAFGELTSLADRLVVDSAEWKSLAAAAPDLRRQFDRLAVSDIAYLRSLGWRARLAEAWPGVRSVKRVEIHGPEAEALLVAGWLRSRLRKRIELTQRRADRIRAIRLDGEALRPPIGKRPAASDLLSEELESLGRDPVYEAAVARLGR